MEPFKFKEIAKALGVKFREILKTRTYAPYSVFDGSERSTGQHWVVSVNYFLNDEPDVIESVLLNFKRSDLRDDCSPDPNDFFYVNDRLLEELIALNEQGKLDPLLPVFLDAERECIDEEESVMINIEARFDSGDDFIRSLLNEDVCIIHLHDGTVLVECMQSERERVFVPEGGRNVPYVIPFDKVELFPCAFQKPAIHRREEEDYVFVLMSFEKDPRLDDAYDAIVRGVTRWNPNATVERVDQIEEDFKITDKVLECIDKATLIIADLTGERPNVYYEVGYARAKKKLLIHTAIDGTKLHFDVKDYNTIFWDSGRTLEKDLARRLRSMLKSRLPQIHST